MSCGDLSKAAVGLRKKADLAFRRHDFGIACAGYEKVVAANPLDASSYADLGLCHFKQGDLSGGVRETIKAIVLGDEQVRRSGYFNLGKFGGRVADPASPVGCEAHFFARNYERSSVTMWREATDETTSKLQIFALTDEAADACFEANQADQGETAHASTCTEVLVEDEQSSECRLVRRRVCECLRQTARSLLQRRQHP